MSQQRPDLEDSRPDPLRATKPPPPLRTAKLPPLIRKAKPPPILTELASPRTVDRLPRLSLATSLGLLVVACLVPSVVAFGLLVEAALAVSPHPWSTGVLQRSIGPLFVGAVVMLVGVLGLAVFLSRAVTRAVRSLIEPALALGSGATVEPAVTPFRETAAVGRAIRQASLMLAATQHDAYHDPLTNLRNRTLFDEMATRQIAQAYRDGAQLAILAIDLDGFKAVNDLHGHAAGDAVLRAVATRITGLLRASDVVSRRGGDEFSALLVDVDGIKTRHIAEKLLAALSQPYPNVVPPVSASIGVARYPRDATTLTELLERADEALYAAKDAGKRRVVIDF